MQTKILESLENRYATKSFSDKKIPDQDMKVLMESMRLSPSSFGLQPWKFIKVQNKDIRESLVAHSRNQRQIADSSDLFVFCMPTNLDTKWIDKYIDNIVQTRWVSVDSLKWYADMMYGFFANSNQDQIQIRAHEQIFIALGFLLNTCALINIDACPIWWFDKSKYDEILWLKEKNLTSVVVCPVWYRSEDDKYATLPKVRFAQDDVFLIIK